MYLALSGTAKRTSEKNPTWYPQCAQDLYSGIFGAIQSDVDNMLIGIQDSDADWISSHDEDEKETKSKKKKKKKINHKKKKAVKQLKTEKKAKQQKKKKNKMNDEEKNSDSDIEIVDATAVKKRNNELSLAALLRKNCMTYSNGLVIRIIENVYTLLIYINNDIQAYRLLFMVRAAGH